MALHGPVSLVHSLTSRYFAPWCSFDALRIYLTRLYVGVVASCGLWYTSMSRSPEFPTVHGEVQGPHSESRPRDTLTVARDGMDRWMVYHRDERAVLRWIHIIPCHAWIVHYRKDECLLSIFKNRLSNLLYPYVITLTTSGISASIFYLARPG